MPAAVPGEVVDDVVLAVTNAILCGSCDIQPVRVAVGLQVGWIEATICDRAAPASHTAPVTTPCGRGGG